MFQANHEPSSILPAAERRIIPFPRRHLRRPDVPIVFTSETSAHLLPKVAAAGGGDGDDGYGKRRAGSGNLNNWDKCFFCLTAA